ncbi:MAG: bifunctional hydroxymethylpyrimidine kinase/phosphomethylpyrimidine kinase [Deltaproteobacteria bacterium]|nr:bifunctional hydroxymethylpyrimidine kinase/phosphomethylpyrimidine kinase [Deltaproteobacteria bacterium]
MSVLVVGSVALDSVETPFGKRPNALGGSATYFSTAASLLTDVQLVAVIGEDFPEEHVQFLKGRGVDLAGLRRVPSGRTFRWAGRYGENLNEAETLETQLNVFADFRPELPEHFRSTGHVFLANIHPELQLRVLDQVRDPKLVALDTMNFWIKGERAALLKVLKRADVLTINDGEARLLAGEHNVVKAAAAIRKMGVGAVVVKRGEYGALYFHDDTNLFWAPAYPLESVFDPTGAGDSFAGGFMGYMSRVANSPVYLRQAVVMGCMMASFTVEEFSVDRLARVTKAELMRRFERFRQLTTFEDIAEIDLVAAENTGGVGG